MRGQHPPEEKRCFLEDLVGHRMRGLAKDCDVLVVEAWGPFAKVLRLEKSDAPGSALFYRERPGGNPIILNLTHALVAAEDLGIYKPPKERPEEVEDDTAEPIAERRL